MKLKFTIIGFMTILLFSTVLHAQQLTSIEHLGKMIYFDPISNPDGMSCATCHSPQTGFTGPKSDVNKRFGVYFGAVTERFGNRKPPSAAYATYSPVFHYDAAKQEFIGGNFWDGRATGLRLGNPAAEQALGPFLNPLEHNNVNKTAVLMQIASAMYSNMWSMVWGEPISYNTEEKINLNYDRVGLSIAAYEGSMMVNSFSSKYDYYLKGQATLTPQELQGLNLFNGDGMCSSCHSSDGLQPLFTDFTYENVGAPRNPTNPFYDMDQVIINGAPVNPLGKVWIDKGLGGFLETLSAENPWNLLAPANMGKHKVPTLRNVDKHQGSNFTKAYFHNGVFKSLKEVVHFFNTRDILQWPSPEVNANINTTVGNLGLTNSEEDAIVAFLSTLSAVSYTHLDVYKRQKQYTAVC